MNIKRWHVFSNSLRFLSSSLGKMAGVALHDAVEMSDYAHVSVPTPSTGESLGNSFLKEVFGANKSSVQPPLRKAAGDYHEFDEVRVLEVLNYVVNLLTCGVLPGFVWQGHRDNSSSFNGVSAA